MKHAAFIIAFEAGELDVDDGGDDIVSFTSDILGTLHLEWI